MATSQGSGNTISAYYSPTSPVNSPGYVHPENAFFKPKINTNEEDKSETAQNYACEYVIWKEL
jgi:hypothetical protein